MHRAGVGGAGQRRVGFGIGWRKIFVGAGEEALKAASRTEVVVVAIVPCVVLAGRRIDLHAADRIGDRAVASGRPRRRRAAGCAARIDRKSTRLNSVTNAHLVCRLLLEKTTRQTYTIFKDHTLT